MNQIIKKIYNEVQRLKQENKNHEAYKFLKDLSVDLLMYLYDVCYSEKIYDEAKKILDMIDKLEPNIWQIAVNKCDFHYKKLDFDCASKYIEKAIMCPEGNNKLDVLYNYAVIMAESGKKHQAIDMYRQILKSCPDHKSSLYNLSSELIITNQWDEGWKLYEKRFYCYKHLQEVKNRFEGFKYYDGENLKGKKIIVFNEQGAGDYFNFVRFINDLKNVQVVLTCNPHSEKLFRNSPLNTYDIVTDMDVLRKKHSNANYVVSVCSLPMFCNIKNDTNLFQKQYLNTNKKIKIKSLSTTKPNVGLVYYGSPHHPLDYKRSMKASQVKILEKCTNVNVLSLQLSNERVRVHNGLTVDMEDEQLNIENISKHIKTYEDTASILKQLDLLITIDSSIAHVAGGLGIKTWLLLDYNNDFRWGTNGNTTNWYPSFEIIRQQNIYDWDSVANQVCEKLSAF